MRTEVHPKTDKVITESEIQKTVKWNSGTGWLTFTISDGKVYLTDMKLTTGMIKSDPDGFVAFAEACRDALLSQEVIQRLKE